MSELDAVHPNPVDNQPGRRRNRTYVVCASPRTGSTLLCSGLIKTGVAGYPRENFDDRADVDTKYKAQLGVEGDASYLRKILRLSRTANGMRGLKIHWHQLRVLDRMLRAANQSLLDAGRDIDFFDMQKHLFGPVKWIWLRRRDKVAQAVSLYRASRSHVWHHPTTKERATADDAIEYDFRVLDNLVHRCFAYDTNWMKYLDVNNTDALVVWYEDLSAEYQATMGSVLQFLGIPDADPGPPRLNKLAGGTSAEWVGRYKEEKAKSVLSGNDRSNLPLQISE